MLERRPRVSYPLSLLFILTLERPWWMEHYVMLGGVRSWSAEQGAGDPLVLPHHGLVDARAFGPNLAAWSERFHTFTPERRGHGHTEDVEGPLTFEQMAQDTVAPIRRRNGH